MHTYVHTYKHTCARVCGYPCMHAYTHAHTHTQLCGSRGPVVSVCVSTLIVLDVFHFIHLSRLWFPYLQNTGISLADAQSVSRFLHPRGCFHYSWVQCFCWFGEQGLVPSVGSSHPGMWVWLSFSSDLFFNVPSVLLWHFQAISAALFY